MSELAEKMQMQLPAVEQGCIVGKNGLKQSA